MEAESTGLVEVEGLADLATSDAIKDAARETAPKLAILATGIGNEERAIRGLVSAIQRHYGDEGVKGMMLFGGSPSSDDLLGAQWIFSSVTGAAEPACYDGAKSVCVALLWPSCAVRADFHHVFHDMDHVCVVHSVSKGGDSPSSRENEAAPLLRSWSDSCLISAHGMPECREILTVADLNGENPMPAAAWYDQATSNSIDKWVSMSMEDRVGLQRCKIRRIWLILVGVFLSIPTTFFQIANLADLAGSCDKDSNWRVFAMFRLSLASLSIITFFNAMSLSIIP